MMSTAEALEGVSYTPPTQEDKNARSKFILEEVPCITEVINGEDRHTYFKERLSSLLTIRDNRRSRELPQTLQSHNVSIEEINESFRYLLASGEYDDEIIQQQVLSRVVDIVHTDVLSPIGGAFREIVSIMQRYSRSMKPPLSLSGRTLNQLEAILEKSDALLPAYKGVIRILGKTARYSMEKGSPTREGIQALDTITTQLVDARSSSGSSNYSVLAFISGANEMLGASRWARRLMKVNESAKEELFAKSYKGIFLLSPRPISEGGEVGRHTDHYSSGNWAFDAHHYLYKVNSRFMTQNPYTPKVPSVGPFISKPGGSRQRSIAADVQTVLRVPRRFVGDQTTSTEQIDYVRSVLNKYRSLVSKHFLENYGLRVNVTASTVKNLSSTEQRQTLTNGFRRHFSLASRGKADPRAMKMAYPSAFGQLPYFYFSETGSIKRKYHKFFFIKVKVELVIPDEYLSTENLLDMTPEAISLKEETEENIVGMLGGRSMANHPLVHTEDGEFPLSPQQVAEEMVDSSLNINGGETLSSYLRSRVPHTRQGDSMITNTSGNGTIAPVVLGTGNTYSATPHHYLPLLLSTNSVIASTDDFLQIISTLHRRQIRGEIC